MSFEMRLPFRQIPRRYRKTYVYGPRPIVGRNESARKIRAFSRGAADKEQQNMSGRNVKGQKRESSTSTGSPRTRS